MEDKLKLLFFTKGLNLLEFQYEVQYF